MPKVYFLDKRLMPNGQKGQINLDNALNLYRYISDISTEVSNEITNDSVSELEANLKELVIVEESYSALPTDYRILVDQDGEAVTITLPTATGITGKTYFIKAITFTDPVTITVDGIELIDGNTEIVLNDAYEYVEVVAADDEWYIVNSNYTTP